MNILLINHYAGSPAHGMEYRAFYLAREWVRAGHRVLVVAADFSHLRQVNPPVRHSFMRETVEGIDYLWVKTPRYEGNGFRRVMNMVAFMLRLRTVCLRPITAFNPDLVIASSTYTWDNWAASFYARRFGAKHVYEVHDLWPLTPRELAGMSRWNPFILSLQLAEDFACRRADKIVSILPAARPHLEAHGMDPHKYVHIPNGVVRDEWQTPSPLPDKHARALEALRGSTTCLVGYVGGLNFGDTLETLVEAGSRACLKDIGVVCVGDGIAKKRLQDKAEALSSRVQFLDSVPKKSVPSLLGIFDILYIGWARSPLYQFGISPNKLYEYMMAAKPILCAIEAANDPVREAGCGLTVPPEDVGAICDGILALATLPEEERRSMGERGRQYAEQNHQIDELAKRFLASVLSPSQTPV